MTCTGYYNNTVNVVSTVHCLFGGVAPAVHCRARCRKSRKKRRGARLMQQQQQPPPRRSSRRCRRPRYGRAAESSRCHCRAPHDAERSTPAALGRARPVHACSLPALSSRQVPHRRKRQPAARTARAIALVGVFGQALKRPPRPLVSCVAARSLVSGGGAGRVCRATLQQPRCARNQHACCLPSHRAVARRPPPPAFRRAPPDAEACSFSIAAKQERHLANDAAHPFMDEMGHGKNTAWPSHP